MFYQQKIMSFIAYKNKKKKYNKTIIDVKRTMIEIRNQLISTYASYHFTKPNRKLIIFRKTKYKKNLVNCHDFI